VQVLVATDIVARGIDVEELSHVVNFDVPHVPEDYIHRVGRTARADATGDAFTFVSPEEENDLKAIERAVGKRIPRLTLAGFDYATRPAERFEVPLAERIADIRKRKQEERARAKEKLERKAQRQADETQRVASKDANRSSRPAPRPAREGDRPFPAEGGQGGPRRGGRGRGGGRRSTSVGGGGGGR
jgi:ATP-dependent RNA helicase RhlE